MSDHTPTSSQEPASEAEFAAARKAMVVSQLRPQGVSDARVLAAMAVESREQYVGADQQALAYGDRALHLDNGLPMMSPVELGMLLTRLAPMPGECALVVGGGGAYTAALLRRIGLDVETAEGVEAPGTAKFDLIIVEGAIERLPESFGGRLAPGGRVGAALISDGVPRLAIGRGVAVAGAASSIAFTSFAGAGVSALPAFASAPAFRF